MFNVKDPGYRINKISSYLLSPKAEGLSLIVECNFFHLKFKNSGRWRFSELIFRRSSIERKKQKVLSHHFVSIVDLQKSFDGFELFFRLN